jgi:hypothetical protein
MEQIFEFYVLQLNNRKVNYKMKLFYQLSIIGLLIFFAGCSKDLEPSGLSDAEIIQMIKDSELEDIEKSDLPTQSQNVVDQDYFEYVDVATGQASGLGYEVALAGRGHRIGSRYEIYFNLEGRKLDPNDWGDKRGWDKDGYDREFGVQGDWRCFELVFPLTFNMPDGSSVMVESDNENSWDEIKVWYEENPDSEDKPEMQFPVVIFYNDEANTLSNSEELRGAYARCEPRRNRDDYERNSQCFSLVYPVTYTMPDGSSMEITGDDEEGWSLLKDWYEENSGYEEVRPELHYPVDIVFETEEGEAVFTISSEEEMELAKRDCREEGEGEDNERECFEVVLPITFVMPDGSLLTVLEEADWRNVELWYVENHEVEDEPGYQFPVDIVYETEDGNTTVTINSQEEMDAAEQDCWGDDG